MANPSANMFKGLAEDLRKKAAKYEGHLVNLAAEAKVSRQWLSLFVNKKAKNATIGNLDRLHSAILKRESSAQQ